MSQYRSRKVVSRVAGGGWGGGGGRGGRESVVAPVVVVAARRRRKVGGDEKMDAETSNGGGCSLRFPGIEEQAIVFLLANKNSEVVTLLANFVKNLRLAVRILS